MYQLVIIKNEKDWLSQEDIYSMLKQNNAEKRMNEEQKIVEKTQNVVWGQINQNGCRKWLDSNWLADKQQFEDQQK